MAALDAISNAVVANNTQDNIGFRSNSSFLIEDILFPRPKVRKNYLLFQKTGRYVILSKRRGRKFKREAN